MNAYHNNTFAYILDCTIWYMPTFTLAFWLTPGRSPTWEDCRYGYAKKPTSFFILLKLIIMFVTLYITEHWVLAPWTWQCLQHDSTIMPFTFLQHYITVPWTWQMHKWSTQHCQHDTCVCINLYISECFILIQNAETALPKMATCVCQHFVHKWLVWVYSSRTHLLMHQWHW